MRESAIESSVCRYAKDCGILAYKFNSMGRAGVPDRLFLVPDGRIFFIEFKTPTGRLSKLQGHEIRRIRRVNHDVYVVNSVPQGREIIDGYA